MSEEVKPSFWEGIKLVDAPPKRDAMGFFTDSTLCIGCKACEVACKQWNGLPADGMEWTGQSYDNTRHLSATTWRHVTFTEISDLEFRNSNLPEPHPNSQFEIPNSKSGFRWLFNSDVCKHCTEAPCQQVCPTGALIRNEFDDVYLQQDVCNGCGYCVVACPFGVLGRSEEDGRAHKCTLCYDRQKDGLEPACAKACPTDAITFGPVEDLRRHAEERLQKVRNDGHDKAYLYGADDAGEYKRLNAFFL
ncbi:MAG: 4Fe-4S dicluster domain-containing protein, partial [Chloroflexota bacterium]|nr:4Fe-4S dicluster domain-containing protein [Chloroflexota bacterium]